MSQATFDDIPRLLLDASFREACVERVVNKNVRRFWTVEYPKYNKGDILPVLNKVGSFLSIPVLRKLLVENKTQLSLRSLMDHKKIFLVNLSKGSLGSDGAHLLASLLLSSLASAGFSRIDTPEEQRIPFILFLDEFQNYTSLSLVEMLSELRKFKLGFVLAHQYMGQLDTKIREAVLGNIGTVVCFRVGQIDAKYMAQEFYPVFKTDDFINLEHYHIYLKLLINGKVSSAFSAKTLSIKELLN